MVCALNVSFLEQDADHSSARILHIFLSCYALLSNVSLLKKDGSSQLDHICGGLLCKSLNSALNNVFSLLDHTCGGLIQKILKSILN